MGPPTEWGIALEQRGDNLKCFQESQTCKFWRLASLLDDGGLRPWHYTYVYSIESRLVIGLGIMNRKPRSSGGRPRSLTMGNSDHGTTYTYTASRVD